MIINFNDVFETINYPSGEFHQKIRIGTYTKLQIVANIHDFNGLMQCYLGAKALERAGAEFEFIIPFFPFARDDRRNSPHEVLELETALEIASEFDPIAVDLHSDVSAFALRQFPQIEVVREYTLRTDLFSNDPIIAIPDAGAVKKAHTWLGQIASEDLGFNREMHLTLPGDTVQCLKKRDSTTGKLSGFSVVDPEKVRDRNVVIVDDICDGGGTFIGLGKELKAAGANNLRLAVTHGLFTKGLSPLKMVFEKIYTLNTCQLNDPYLVKVPLNNIIERGNAI